MRAEPPSSWLRRLWERMTSAYGQAWTSVHGVSPQNPETGALTVDGDTWSKALAGVSAQQLGAGLDACIAESGQFPPSVGRFRAMCLGIPAFETVRLETLRTDAERSPFTRLAWSFVDGYAHRHASADRANGMLRAAYDRAVEHVMRGEPLPSDAPAIEAPSRSKPHGIPLTREERTAHLQQLLAKQEGVEFNPRTTDPTYDPAKERRQHQQAQAMRDLQGFEAGEEDFS